MTDPHLWSSKRWNFNSSMGCIGIIIWEKGRFVNR